MSTNMEVQKIFCLYTFFLIPWTSFFRPPKQEHYYDRLFISRCGSYPVTQKAAGNIGLPAMEIL